VNVATGEKRRITMGDAVQPQWSPHGYRIAYWAARGAERQRDIGTIPAAGGEPVFVTNDKAVDWNPVWSPDGQRIAFQSTRAGAWDIWTINPDGSGLTQLTKRSGAHGPTWSPDGTRMAYTERIDANRVWLFDPRRPWEGQTPEMLPAGSAWLAQSWSPDGKWLAGVLLPDGGIVIYSMDSRSYTKLTNTGWLPFWLSDNRRLLFASEGKLSLGDRQSRRVHDVLSEPGRDFLVASLSHDDRQIYLLRGSTEADIWLATLKR
jgi:Tol biopolymer transport system component